MNKRIFELAKEADLIKWDPVGDDCRTPDYESVVKAQKFAELVIKDYAEESVVSQMQDPAFEAAMDRYYERKWAHRFD